MSPEIFDPHHLIEEMPPFCDTGANGDVTGDEVEVTTSCAYRHPLAHERRGVAAEVGESFCETSS